MRYLKFKILGLFLLGICGELSSQVLFLHGAQETLKLPVVNENKALKIEKQIKKLDIGKSVVLDFTLSDGFIDKKGELTMSLGKNKITLGKLDSDVCIKSDKTSYLVEFIPYYTVSRKIKNIESNKNKKRMKSLSMSLIIERVGKNKAKWAFVSSSTVYWMDMDLSKDFSSLKITTTKPLKGKLELKKLSVGNLAESFYNNSIKAVQVPREAEYPELYIKLDNNKIPGVNSLKLNGLEGKVTKKEMNGLVDYFLKRPLLTTNYNNTIFNGWNRAYMMKWVYDKTSDLRILDRMIQQSDTLHKYRDDNYGKYKTLMGDNPPEFTKGWSHFRTVCYVDNEPVKQIMGIATLGTGTNFPASVALTIASHPEIWNKKYGEKTYKEVALDMLDYVHQGWDYAIKHYYDPETNLLLSPKYGAEPEGFVPQWNRIFPLMTAGNSLVDAYALFKIKDNRAEKIDMILKSLFKTFWENTRIEKVSGKDVVYYPYGVVRWSDGNKKHTEDTPHMGFDSRGFRVFHNSGRYWNENQTKLLSNLMCYKIIKDDKGTFTTRLDTEDVKKFTDWNGLPDMMWLAEFEPLLKDKLLKYTLKVMSNRESMDGRVVFNILYYREKMFGME